jgi:hypothetical protein
MTERDKKTIRIAAIAIVIYLAAFGGFKMWRKGASGRDDYQTLVHKAERLQEEVRADENKALLFDKLSELYGFDPRKIKKETLVADASAAIQSAAQQGGIQLGPIRESPARSSGRELTTIQVEGSGAVPAALGLLHKLRTLGYPLLIDSVQFGPAQGRPGQVKVNVTITILNYDQFKEKEGPNA